MTHTIFRSLFLVGVMFGISAPVFAQQTPAPAATDTPAKPAADAPAAPAAPQATTAPSAAAPAAAAPKAADDVPSPALLRKAKSAGYYTKVKHGNVIYCKSEPKIGSRFADETCIDENQLEATLIQAQAQRDAVQHMQGAPSNTH